MEMIMSTNKIVIITLLIILLLIGIPTLYKTINIHEDNLYKVNEKLVIEAYQKCLNEDKCTSDKATLKELYNYKYLTKVVDPVTKKVYSESSYVIKKDNNYEFVIVD